MPTDSYCFLIPHEDEGVYLSDSIPPIARRLILNKTDTEGLEIHAENLSHGCGDSIFVSFTAAPGGRAFAFPGDTKNNSYLFGFSAQRDEIQDLIDVLKTVVDSPD